MTSFGMDYKKFERNTQRRQLFVDLEIKTEQVFETLETDDIYTKTNISTNVIKKLSTKTLETPFTIIMVHTSSTTHRNRQDIRINIDNTTNQETYHLHT